jgi:hypothetical protein
MKNEDGKRVDDAFTTAKQYLLGNPKTFRETLIEYDKDNINPQLVLKLEKNVLNQPEFNLEKA